MSVTLDGGTAVVHRADIAIRPGEKVLVTGDSGTGKSTLARALAGVWPWGKGDIEIAAGGKLSFCRSGHMCRRARFEGQ